jgi:poly(3-hydroxybutyrate) depolymerase
MITNGRWCNHSARLILVKNQKLKTDYHFLLNYALIIPINKTMRKSIFLSLLCLVIVLGSVAWRSGNSEKIVIQQRDTSERNIVYGSNINSEGKNQALNMDIYYPPNIVDGKKYPMVMLIHGGTFLNGNKENMGALCKQLADSGFVAVTINYRLGWNALSALGGCASLDINSLTLANYRGIQDAHAAMRFLVSNAKKYHIDTKWLFIGGGSAGGVIALDITYLTQKFASEKLGNAVTTLGNINNAGNIYTDKFKIKGICDMWGALPDSTLITKTNAVPTIFYHGTADKTVPYDKGYYIPNCTRAPELYGSACLYRQTLAAGQTAVFNTSIGGKHGPTEFTGKIMMSNIACFFHHVMQGTAKSAGYYNAQEGCR